MSTTNKSTAKKDKKSKGFTDEETSRDEGSRPRTEGGSAREQEQVGGGTRRARGDRRDEGTDRAMAERLHAIVTASAPGLWPKTWYGMPAYAKDGKVVCFFKSAGKFKSRYATFGFEEAAISTKAPCGRPPSRWRS